jgi:hypothetical protein
MFNFFKQHIQLNYNKNNHLVTIPVEGYDFNIKSARFVNEPVTVNKTTFDVLYEEFTYGLCNHIPKKYNNYIHSGGSLHDILTHNFISLLRLKNTDLPFFACDIVREYVNDDMDIDIFLYNCDKNKLEFIQDVITSLHQKHNIIIKTRGCIIEIVVENIPRTLQFIFTDKTSAEEIINAFDSTHLMMYYNGSKLWMKDECKKALHTQTFMWRKHKTSNYSERIFKNIKRNYKIGIDSKLFAPLHDIFLFKTIKYDDLLFNAMYRSNALEYPCKNITLIRKNDVSDLIINNNLSDIEEDEYNNKKDITLSSIKKLFKNYLNNIESFPNSFLSYPEVLAKDESSTNCYSKDCFNEESFKSELKKLEIDFMEDFKDYNIYRPIFSADCFMFLNCYCSKIYQRPVTGYYIATVHIDPKSEICKYINMLTQKWNEFLHELEHNRDEYGICLKPMREYHYIKPKFKNKINKKYINSCEPVLHNNLYTIKLHMPSNIKMIKNKIYPIILARPKLYIKNNIVTMYWRREDKFDRTGPEFIDYNKEKDDYDHCDYKVLRMMQNVKTDRMKHIIMELNKEVKTIIKYTRLNNRISRKIKKGY